MPSGRVLRLVAESSVATSTTSAAAEAASADEPEQMSSAAVTSEDVTSGPRVANDAAPEEPDGSKTEQTAPDPRAESEGPASAPRAKTPSDQPPPSLPVKQHPPADPTELPPDRSSLIPEPAVRNARKPPLLASEALMDDLAPVEPSRDVARYWCVGVGLGFIALGSLPLIGIRAGQHLSVALSFLLGGLTLVAAVDRISYRHRSVAMLALGLLAALMGLGNVGPAAGISLDAPGLGIARAFAAIALPGALLFRARYRAYSGARWLLGAAFVVALPYIAWIIGRVVLFEPTMATAGAMVALVVTLVGLVGFMGKETTGGGTYVGLGVLIGLGTELFLADLGHAGAFSTSLQTTAITAASTLSFVAATGLSALGLFQLLASRLSRDARRIDLHAATPEPERPRPKKSEWTT